MSSPDHAKLRCLRFAEQAEQRLDDIEGKLRKRAARAALRASKRLLRKIDPIFSGSGYNPQDVKVMFNPVTYVVFDGMSQGDVREVQLLATPAQNRVSEQIQSSIEQIVKQGNFEFRTLRVDYHGRVA